MDHLPDRDILTFLASMQDTSRTSLLHLLDCPRCRRKGRGVARGLARDPLDTVVLPGHSRLWRRIHEHGEQVEAARAQDERRGQEIFSALLGLPAEQWAGAVEAEARFQVPSLAMILTAAAEASLEEHPRRTEELAKVAVIAACRSDVRRFGEALLAQLLAGAWSLAGEARRRLGDLAGAEAAFTLAQNEAAILLPEDAARASCCRWLARLRQDQERLDESLALSARAAALYEEHGRWPELAETLAEQGFILLDEDPYLALVPFEAALALLDERLRPVEALRIRYTMALAYAENGLRREARELLEESAFLKEWIAEPLAVLRALLAEAEVMERVGLGRQAVELLTTARTGFLGQEAAYDAAITTVRLARLFASQGNAGALEQTVADAVSLFREEAIPARIRKLLSFALTFSLRGHPRGEDLLGQTAEFLERARPNPDLPFTPDPRSSRSMHWSELQPAYRRAVAQLAGARPEVADQPAEEIEPALREALAWVSELEQRLWIEFETRGPAADAERRR